MHARIHLDYGAASVIDKLDADKYAQLRATLPGLELPEEKPGKISLGWDKNDHTIDLTTTGVALIEIGLTFEVKRFTSTYKVADHATHHHLHVAIPNLLLFAVDEVLVLNDACTDSLQSHLDDGWRILAVCPPPAQRRPDYVLGRQRGLQS